MRARLKPLFVRAGITVCELRCEGCWKDNALSFAHSLKRRHIKTIEEEQEVILCCVPCHDLIEALPPWRMAEVVRLLIFERRTPVEKIFD